VGIAALNNFLYYTCNCRFIAVVLWHWYQESNQGTRQGQGIARRTDLWRSQSK